MPAHVARRVLEISTVSKWAVTSSCNIWQRLGATVSINLRPSPKQAPHDPIGANCLGDPVLYTMKVPEVARIPSNRNKECCRCR